MNREWYLPSQTQLLRNGIIDQVEKPLGYRPPLSTESYTAPLRFSSSARI